MTPMVWHQGIHDKMGMQRMRREGVTVEGAPGLVPQIRTTYQNPECNGRSAVSHHHCYTGMWPCAGREDCDTDPHAQVWRCKKGSCCIDNIFPCSSDLLDHPMACLCIFDSTSSASYSVWPTCTENGLPKKANSGMRVGAVMPPVGSGAVAESGLV